MEKNIVVVIEGPNGAGKNSIIRGLCSTYPGLYKKPANVTTREMRQGEKQGDPYYFVTVDQFLKMRTGGEIFEDTVRSGTYRGMSQTLINKVIEGGRVPLINCDLMGVAALKKLGKYGLVTIFVTATKEEIQARLNARGDSHYDKIKRLNDYENYMTFEKHFDYSVHNKDLETTINIIHTIIQKNLKAN